MSGFYEPPPSASSEFRERLFNPKWALIEAALGRPVPGVLRELYAAPDVLMRSHFYCTSPDGTRRVWVDLFLPMDEEALRPYGQTLPAGAVFRISRRPRGKRRPHSHRGSARAVGEPSRRLAGSGNVRFNRCRTHRRAAVRSDRGTRLAARPAPEPALAAAATDGRRRQGDYNR